jgi:KDO2-lipid IV(A) lauroyltransferase
MSDPSPSTDITMRDRLEALGARGLLALFQGLGPDRASALGGRLMAAVGPRLRAHRTARDNLRIAFPECDEAEREEILRGMWDNLGRTLGELPHLHTLSRLDGPYVDLEGQPILDDLRAAGGPVVFVSGHLGNWEALPWVLSQAGMPMHVFFRAPNNPLVADLYTRIRQGAGGGLLPKGRVGAREALLCLKRGQHLGVLVDQKMNDGIPVPFFGRDAMTAPALAQLALRFNAPVVPLRVSRLDGCRLRVTVEPPLALAADPERHAAIADVMGRVNGVLERWIRDTPTQWLWVHQRWPKG